MAINNVESEFEVRKIDDHDHSHRNNHSHQHVETKENQFQPSFKAIFSNWRRSDASFLAKLGMAFRNNWIKIRRGSSCCGHHGEVGC
ncbi:MAG TPA: hypothetical protein VIM51_00360 [Desulfosporosinus sp.]